MTLGIGLYAPCMILVALLGMNPRVAFPIMMGSCAFLMPIGSLRFIAKGSYSLKAAVGPRDRRDPGGPLRRVPRQVSSRSTLLRWLVFAVVVYAAVAMLKSSRSEASSPAPAPAPTATP